MSVVKRAKELRGAGWSLWVEIPTPKGVEQGSAASMGPLQPRRLDTIERMGRARNHAERALAVAPRPRAFAALRH